MMYPPYSQLDGRSSTANAIPQRAKYYLCTSYALAAWAWRSWEFVVALVLIELYPNSLFMVSAYGLLDNLARVVLGPVVGTYIDRHERLPGARAMLLLQNQCIGGSAAAALLLLWPGSPATKLQAAYWPLMWLLTLLGAASSAGSTGVSISVEREAVKALCGEDGRALASLNATTRAIDLSALLLAPLLAGLLMTAAGPFVAVGGMAGYCCVAYLPEVLLLRAAFRAAPVLGQSKVRTDTAAAGGDLAGPGAPTTPNNADERAGLLAGYDTPGMDLSTPCERRHEKDDPGASCTAKAADDYKSASTQSVGGKPASAAATSETPSKVPLTSTIAAAAQRHWCALCRSSAHAVASYLAAWRVYLSSSTLLLCLALALLYMTVLSLGFLMTSFLKWSGLSEVEVSAYRGVGALTGLAATALFPPLSARAGLRFCAAAGITYQLVCLAAGVVPTVIRVAAAGGGGGQPQPPSVDTVRLLVAGLVSSRTGLWMYDLSVTQAIQESVRQEDLGALYGVQSSLQAGMEMLSFVAGLASPAPWHFHWLMLGSLCSVGTAAALVWSHVLGGRRERGARGGSGVHRGEGGVAA